MRKIVNLICRPRVVDSFLFKNFIMMLLFAGLLFFFGSKIAFASALENRSNKIFPIILPDIQIIKSVVRRGDTISCILNKYLPLRTIYKINDQSQDVFSLTQIKRGQRYKIILQDDVFVGFEYEIDKEDRVILQKEKTNFSISKVPIDYEVELEVVSATIKNNLFEAVRKAGERNEFGQKLSDIFAWDIDFLRDIQFGDQFRVLVEKRYREGKLFGYGKIQAAYFINKGNVFKAFLHKDSEGISGYYDENGKSLQKAFLKTPVAFSRISSRFSKKRFHPILNVYRAHRGVDYAAPTGTPIKTVGDGIITGIGYSKSTGNYITIRHYNGYMTRYYHMSKFAKGMKKNKRVIQGDRIGHVGMTGYATGPHLCFRMKKDGKSMDPLKHKSPSSNPIKSDEMKQFLVRISELSKMIVMAEELAFLDQKQRNHLYTAF